jgi:hypothetical protein
LVQIVAARSIMPEAEPHKEFPMNQNLILIAEDDADIRDMLAVTLEERVTGPWGPRTATRRRASSPSPSRSA